VLGLVGDREVRLARHELAELLRERGAPDERLAEHDEPRGPAAEAVRQLNDTGRRVRLVSMPSSDVFDAQDAAWRESVLPAAVTRRVAVEAGATQSWWRYVGLGGRVLGIDRFGASGKAADLFKQYGLTGANVTQAVEALLAS
jgi:transketolase